jgi:hypothetical protein
MVPPSWTSVEVTSNVGAVGKKSYGFGGDMMIACSSSTGR